MKMITAFLTRMRVSGGPGAASSEPGSTIDSNRE